MVRKLYFEYWQKICTAMPFGLKDAKVTYKHVMIVTFHDIIRKESKDYVISKATNEL